MNAKRGATRKLKRVLCKPIDPPGYQVKKTKMRQVVLNNETTGLQPEGGDRLVEIAGLELMHRTPTGIYFHHYLNPERPVDPMALALYGFDGRILSLDSRVLQTLRTNY